MDSRIVNDLLRSTVEVFQRMFSVELAADPKEADEAELQKCQIMGMVGLAGRSMGTISLHCTRGMGIRIASGMLRTEVEEVTDDVRDAVGEITNMVAGSFKTKLSRDGELFDLSVPTVVVGERYSMRSPARTPTTILGFGWGEERLYVRLSYAP